jgi:hypothetical protein
VTDSAATDLSAAVESLDAARLAPIVRAATDRPDAELRGWRAARLGHGARRAAGGVYRISGTALDGVAEVPWSIILKLVVPGDRSHYATGDESDPRNMHYWAREPLAFATGLLDDLPGIAAPRCFRVDEEPGSYWLWLEDVREAGPARWPLERYGTAARHLGVFTGAFSSHRPAPTQEWLSSGYVPYLRDLPPPAPDDLMDPAVWDHPAVRRLFPRPLVERVASTVVLVPRLLDALAALPEVLCHNDPFRRNLIAAAGPDARERTIAIDWEYLGAGAAGVDAGILTTATLLFGEFDGTRAAELDALVFAHFLDGLRSTGWRGDPAAVRLAYVAIGVLREGVQPLRRAIRCVTSDDPEYRASIERWQGMPVDRAVEQFAGFGMFMLDLAREAEELLELVRFSAAE